MKGLKKLRLAVTVFMFVNLLMCIPCSAQEIDWEENVSGEYANETYYLPNGSEVKVLIPCELTEEVTDDDIYEIIETHQIDDSCLITIYDVAELGNSDDAIAAPANAVEPYIYKTTKKEISDKYVDANYFIISVAKGETVRLSKTFSKTCRLDITSGVPLDSTKIGSDITFTRMIFHEYTGPGEDSPYNSRSFYVKFYVQDYEWRQERYIYNTLEMWSEGTATIPKGYEAYSIDKYVPLE